MYYDIRNVGSYFLQGRELLKDGKVEDALECFQRSIKNYNGADNEYLLPADSPYTDTYIGHNGNPSIKTHYPSPRTMKQWAGKALQLIKPHSVSETADIRSFLNKTEGLIQVKTISNEE